MRPQLSGAEIHRPTYPSALNRSSTCGSIGARSGPIAFVKTRAMKHGGRAECHRDADPCPFHDDAFVDRM